MKNKQLDNIRRFYNETYYSNANPSIKVPRHLRALARRLEIKSDIDVLDVACGTGAWLKACQERGARVAGVDLSDKAIEICHEILPEGEFYATPAEILPFSDNRFDLITCLGSLEHFIDPLGALKEMLRVAKPDATFVILVPNADFLTRKLGLFVGTHQIDAKEDVRTLSEWEELFGSAGLEVIEKWRDLHVLSWHWIKLGGWYAIPIRAAQALALVFWPLKWQYQVYHLLHTVKTKSG